MSLLELNRFRNLSLFEGFQSLSSGTFFDWVSDLRHVCEPGLPGSGLHHHAGLCVEPEEPQRPHELLWPPELPGPIPALGSDGLLPPAGELHHRGPSGSVPGSRSQKFSLNT